MLLLLTACDEKPIVTVYKKEIVTAPPTCLKLQVQSSNKQIINILEEMYDFNSSCSYRLDVNYKEGIHCNSTNNACSSALGNFPHSYLNMEIRKGFSLYYSYYIDLKEEVSDSDLEKGMERIKDDLHIGQ